MRTADVSHSFFRWNLIKAELNFLHFILFYSLIVGLILIKIAGHFGNIRLWVSFKIPVLWWHWRSLSWEKWAESNQAFMMRFFFISVERAITSAIKVWGISKIAPFFEFSKVTLYLQSMAHPIKNCHKIELRNFQSNSIEDPNDLDPYQKITKLHKTSYEIQRNDIKCQ